MAEGAIVIGLGTHAAWYATRAAGLVTLVLLTATVVLGITSTRRRSATRSPRFVTQDLHRNISLLAVAFLGLHVATTVIDSYTSIHALDAVVPFRASYRPLWLGLGAVAFDLVLALVITSLLRRRLGLRAWRTTHWLAYASWPIAVLHGLGSGTDTRSPWVVGLTAACGLAVFLAVAGRVVDVAPRAPRRALTAGAAVLATPAVLAGWAVAGPLTPTWGHHAAVVAQAPVPAVATIPVTAARTAPRIVGPRVLGVPVRAQFTGTLTSRATRHGHLVRRLDARLTHGAHGWMSVAAAGRPTARGGLELVRSGAVLGSMRVPVQFRGQVSSYSANRILLDLTRNGVRYRAVVTLSRRGAGGRVLGRVVVVNAPPPPVRTVVVVQRTPTVVTAPVTQPVPTRGPTSKDSGWERDDEHEHEGGDD